MGDATTETSFMTMVKDLAKKSYFCDVVGSCECKHKRALRLKYALNLNEAYSVTPTRSDNFGPLTNIKNDPSGSKIAFCCITALTGHKPEVY